MDAQRRAALLSVHMDLGAGRRGVDMGPSAIRVAGLAHALEAIGWGVQDRGSIRVAEPESATVGAQNLRYLDEVLQVCTALHEAVREALGAGLLPVTLGGDHSIAMGSISAVAAHHEEPIGVLWVDAHTDMNTPESTPSGNIHGMPLSSMLGLGEDALVNLPGTGHPAVAAENVAILGVRSVDKQEREIVRASGVRAFTMSEIDRRGMAACVREALEVTLDGTAGVHLSFDLDAVDPRVAPGVGTAVQGGLTYREAHLVCEEVAASGCLLAMDMVELNPILDETNRTGQLAVELISSALGKRIL